MAGAGDSHSNLNYRNLNPADWKLEFPRAAGDGTDGSCRRVEDTYTNLQPLGHGTYGEVYKAMDIATGDLVALKKIKMENEREGFPITAIREIKLLSMLATANEDIEGYRLRDSIIRLREIVRSDGHSANNQKGSVYMVFDYMEHDMAGLLTRMANEGRSFTIAQIKTYMRQLFYGLALMNAKNILHRDLKNANLLVSNNGDLKIADFGLARYFVPNNNPSDGSGNAAVNKNEDGLKPSDDKNNNPVMTNRVITLWYRPPELCLGADRYGPEVDMWSAGCIMVEMFKNKAVFSGKDEQEQMELIAAALGRPTENNMPGCTSLPRYEEYVAENKKITGLPERIKLWESRGLLRTELKSIRDADPLAADLIENLLVLNPKDRLSAEKACVHKWFFAQPLPAGPKDMPKHQDSHEMGMKRRQPMPPPGAGGGPYGGQHDARRMRTGPGPMHGAGGYHANPQYGQYPHQGGSYQGGGAPKYSSQSEAKYKDERR